jgi:hypothetical protein
MIAEQSSILHQGRVIDKCLVLCRIRIGMVLLKKFLEIDQCPGAGLLLRAFPLLEKMN